VIGLYSRKDWLVVLPGNLRQKAGQCRTHPGLPDLNKIVIGGGRNMTDQEKKELEELRKRVERLEKEVQYLINNQPLQTRRFII
jgi:hypothetical protein